MKILSPTQIKMGTTDTLDHVYGEVPPLWSIDLDDEEAIIKWWEKAISAQEMQHRDRVDLIVRARNFYAGAQSLSLNGKVGIPRDREGREVTNNTSKVIINKVFNLIELWVSKLTRFAPNIIVNPANKEYQDRVSADLGKLIADNIAYLNNLDEILEDVVRGARIDGEKYILVKWNPYKGDYAPEWKSAQKLGVRIPVTGKDGEPILSEEGEPLYIESAPRIGDVEFVPFEAPYIFLEQRQRYSDIDWAITLSFQYVDELKAEYPEKAEEIKAGEFGPFSFPFTPIKDNQVTVWEIYHKSTRFLDSGRYIKLTPSCVLENRDIETPDNAIPLVRLTNVDFQDELHGYSIINNLVLLQVMYNNLWSLGYTNMALGSHAYWLVPTQGNVDITKIRNSASVIKYTGPIAPRLEVFKTVGPEVFNSINQLDQLMTQLSGHQGISQGEPPPGVDAAVALGVLEEQENQRANSDIKKYNAFIKKLFILALGTAQKHYKNDDGRILRIVGKGHQDTIKALDMSKFTGSYDVRVQRASTLSESKSVRLQQLILLRQNAPSKISEERFVSLMELGEEKGFYDIVTASVRAAEAENEAFLSGEMVALPQSFEDHLVHWDVHMKQIQTASFKIDTPEEFKVRVFDHIMVHERQLFMKAYINPTLLQKLVAQDLYPSFYKLPFSLTKLIQYAQLGLPLEQAMIAEQQKQILSQAMQGPPPMNPNGPDMMLEKEPLPEESIPEEAPEDESLAENENPDAPGAIPPNGPAPVQ